MAILINSFLPLLLLFQVHTSTSSSIIINDVKFVVEPKVYQPSSEFSLICTISITPQESHFSLQFFHNDTNIGSYIVVDGEINRWVQKSPYIVESSSIYPTFTAKILPRANTRGVYRCSIGYNEGTIFDYSHYNADSNSWSTDGGQWRAELHWAIFVVCAASCLLLAGKWW